MLEVVAVISFINEFGDVGSQTVGVRSSPLQCFDFVKRRKTN